jgi:hypothetical protein
MFTKYRLRMPFYLRRLNVVDFPSSDLALRVDVNSHWLIEVIRAGNLH